MRNTTGRNYLPVFILLHANPSGDTCLEECPFMEGAALFHCRDHLAVVFTIASSCYSADACFIRDILSFVLFFTTLLSIQAATIPRLCFAAIDRCLCPLDHLAEGYPP